jgi:4-diphosphocytidyl-2-C-methyl-D-erythritol kinase
MIKLHRVAPAKINLMLHVTGRDASGFHDLQSLFAFVDFGDQLWIEQAFQTSVHLSGVFARAVDRADNSLLSAINWFYQKTSFIPQPWRIHLEKNLPVASGLGGGTSDAAAIIALLMGYIGWQPQSLEDFIKASGELGADVPICLAHQLGLGTFFWLEGTGKGEMPQPISVALNKAILLVNPNISCSTGQIFQRFGQNYAPLIQGYREGEDFLAWLAAHRNDLQLPACQLVPEIRDVLSFLAGQPGCLIARMSGSGATCFGIFDSMAQANIAREQIQQCYPQWWIKTVATV